MASFDPSGTQDTPRKAVDASTFAEGLLRRLYSTCRHQDLLLGAAVTGAEQGARDGDAQVQAV